MRKRILLRGPLVTAGAILVTVALVVGSASGATAPTPAGATGELAAQSAGLDITGALTALVSGGSATSLVDQEGPDREPGTTPTGPATTPVLAPSQNVLSPGSATTTARPGWGCGDKNHTHSGPPGRPGATPPPGCTKH